MIRDWHDEALGAIWDRYRDNPRVMDWVNGLPFIASVVPGWRDLETYAYQHGWRGSREIPVAAAGGLGEQDGDEDLLLVGGGRRKRREVNKRHVPDSPFGNTGDELEPVKLPGYIACAEDGGIVDQQLSEMEESGDESGQEEDNNQAEVNQEEVTEKDRCPNICKGRWHTWEILESAVYAWKGKLKGRRCYDCDVKFAHGKRLTREEAKGLYWASVRNPGHHCTTCKVCVCNVCHRNMDLNSPKRLLVWIWMCLDLDVCLMLLGVVSSSCMIVLISF